MFRDPYQYTGTLTDGGTYQQIWTPRHPTSTAVFFLRFSFIFFSKRGSIYWHVLLAILSVSVS
jgi:hypothetical protein